MKNWRRSLSMCLFPEGLFDMILSKLTSMEELHSNRTISSTNTTTESGLLVLSMVVCRFVCRPTTDAAKQDSQPATKADFGRMS